ncbi:hypothetical protein BDW74DRAFT_164621 [Aspergillus multicolor]|uniref:peroxidase family protein n=1 Tax=Aspergillus multicolor TaxID=41759 RepID=UPI003CCCA47A
MHIQTQAAFILGAAILAAASVPASSFALTARATPWAPAGPNNVRAPCPMLNALSNHNYLPHNGKNITQTRLVNVLGTVLRMDEDLVTYLFEQALTTNPAPNATTFNLGHLGRHNILEHDASLSRQDAFFGDHMSFNASIFNQTRAYWPDAHTLRIADVAASRQARINASNSTNPSFVLGETGRVFGYGEVASFMLAFGDKSAGTAERRWVEYLFENERLPYELGWDGPADDVTWDDLTDMVYRFVNATDGLAARGYHMTM